MTKTITLVAMLMMAGTIGAIVKYQYVTNEKRTRWGIEKITTEGGKTTKLRSPIKYIGDDEKFYIKHPKAEKFKMSWSLIYNGNSISPQEKNERFIGSDDNGNLCFLNKETLKEIGKINLKDVRRVHEYEAGYEIEWKNNYSSLYSSTDFRLLIPESTYLFEIHCADLETGGNKSIYYTARGKTQLCHLYALKDGVPSVIAVSKYSFTRYLLGNHSILIKSNGKGEYGICDFETSKEPEEWFYFMNSIENIKQKSNQDFMDPQHLWIYVYADTKCNRKLYGCLNMKSLKIDVPCCFPELLGTVLYRRPQPENWARQDSAAVERLAPTLDAKYADALAFYAYMHYDLPGNQANNTNKALQYYDIARAKGSYYATLLAADANLKLGREERAFELYREVEAVRDSLFNVVITESYLKSRAGTSASALAKRAYDAKDFKRARYYAQAAADRDAPDGTYLLGLIAENIDKNKSGAQEWYKKAADRGHALSQTMMGNKYYEAKDYATALPYLKASAENNNEKSMLYYGNCLNEGLGGAKKDMDKAAELYSACYRLAKDAKTRDEVRRLAVPVYVKLASNRGESKNYSRAIELMDSAIGMNPMNDTIYAQRGDFYHKMGKANEALKDYDMAQTLNISNPDYGKQIQKIADEIEVQKQLVSQQKEDEERRSKLISDAKGYYKAFDYKNAIGYSSNSLEYGETSEAYDIMGDSYQQLCDYQNAVDCYYKALQISYSLRIEDKWKKSKKALKWDRISTGISNAYAIMSNNQQLVGVNTRKKVGSKKVPMASSSQSTTGGRTAKSNVSYANFSNYSRAYEGYADMLLDMHTYWDSKYNVTKRIDYQQKMRNIRTKWEGMNGTPKIFKSKWEDWDGRK